MIKRNKYQSILAKARRYKFRPRPRLRFVTMDFVSEPGIGNGGDDGRWEVSEPGMSGIHHNGKVVKMVATGSFDRMQHVSEEAIKLGALGNPNANGRKYELHPYQQTAVDALNELSLKHTGTPAEELDYFNIWTQGIESGFFDRNKVIERGKTIMIDSMSEAIDKPDDFTGDCMDSAGKPVAFDHEHMNNSEGSVTLAKFVEANTELRAEAKKKLLSGDTIDLPTGFGSIGKMLSGGGFKRGEFIFTGAVPRFGMSRHMLGSIETTYGPNAFMAMLGIEKKFKEEKPEATEAEVFVHVHKQLTSLQRGTLYHYAEYLKKTMAAGIIEEVAGAFDAMLEIYIHINSFIDFIKSDQFIKSGGNVGEAPTTELTVNLETPESITKAVEYMHGMHRSVGEPVANGRLLRSGLQEYRRLAAEKLADKPLDNLCAQFPGDLGEEPKEDKKDV